MMYKTVIIKVTTKITRHWLVFFIKNTNFLLKNSSAKYFVTELSKHINI